MLFIMLIRIKTTLLISFKLRNPGKYTPFTSCSHIYTRLGVEGIYQTRCIEPTDTMLENSKCEDEFMNLLQDAQGGSLETTP